MIFFILTVFIFLLGSSSAYGMYSAANRDESIPTWCIPGMVVASVSSGTLFLIMLSDLLDK